MFIVIRKLIPQKLINYTKHLTVAFLANLYYCLPSKNLTIIGVTGTDGKTTTSTLIYEILKKSGIKVALISTVCAKIGPEVINTGFHVTSPDPWKLQKILRLIRDKNYTHVVLEVTSHGLDQFRFLGIKFAIGVLTNITHEHLDYHQSYNNYLLTKARLLKDSSTSILNIDDKSYLRLKNIIKGKIITYGLNNGDFNLNNFTFKTDLLGKFNLSNCLAAIAVAKTLDINNNLIINAIENFKGVVGRMQEVNTGKNYRVFIDFAHTPNGLENALMTLRNLTKNKVIAVFGCAGLRDKGKRPLMGNISCELADYVILTAEDPRTENVHNIIKEIVSGCKEKNKVYIKPDRQKAIDFALTKLAHKGDIVGIFGKGHEQSMCFGTKEYDWDDHKAVLKTLKGTNVG